VARLPGSGAPASTATGIREEGEETVIELELSRLGRRGEENGPRLRHRLEEVEGVANRLRGRSDDVLERPARRGDESPVQQVPRMPVAAGNRCEEVVLALVVDDDGVGSGPVGDAPMHLLEVVAIVDVERVGVRADAGRLGYCANGRYRCDPSHRHGCGEHREGARRRCLLHGGDWRSAKPASPPVRAIQDASRRPGL
jgi:hypothetical protein